MFRRTLTSALNHVLAGEGWAQERLRGFAGQHLCIKGGLLVLNLAVQHDGLLCPANHEPGTEPAVTIELPPDAPFRFLSGGREATFSAARLTGKADFAETLAFVFRNLRWDIEDDLSKVIGDIAAHRLVGAGAALIGWQKRAATNFAANAAEFLCEESDVIVPARDVARFSTEIRAISEELDGLERRITRL